MHQTDSDTEARVELPLRGASVAALNLYLSLFTILTFCCKGDYHAFTHTHTHLDHAGCVV